MSKHVEESETAKKLQVYATSMFHVQPVVPQLNYAPVRREKNGVLYSVVYLLDGQDPKINNF